MKALSPFTQRQKLAVRAWQRDTISLALCGAQGSVHEASRTLGIDRANLYRLIRSLGIQSPHACEDCLDTSKTT